MSQPAGGFGFVIGPTAVGGDQPPHESMRDDDNGTTETQHNINESADKVRLETKIKRGEGTRDQDEIKVKVKGNDPEEAAQKLHDTVVAVGSNNTVNALRGTQPTSGESDE